MPLSIWYCYRLWQFIGKNTYRHMQVPLTDRRPHAGMMASSYDHRISIKEIPYTERLPFYWDVAQIFLAIVCYHHYPDKSCILNYCNMYIHPVRVTYSWNLSCGLFHIFVYFTCVYLWYFINTLRPRQNGRYFVDCILNVLSAMNTIACRFNLHWYLFLAGRYYTLLPRANLTTN